jgi:hypothetical protein
LLAAQAAPRRVHLAGVVDGAGNPVDLSFVRRIYSSENVQVSAEPAWNQAGLGSL